MSFKGPTYTLCTSNSMTVSGATTHLRGYLQEISSRDIPSLPSPSSSESPTASATQTTWTSWQLPNVTCVQVLKHDWLALLSPADILLLPPRLSPPTSHPTRHQGQAELLRCYPLVGPLESNPSSERAIVAQM